MMIKQKMTLFVLTQKQKQLLTKTALIIYLNQSTLKLYQSQQTFYEKLQVGLMTQPQIVILIFQSIIS